MILHKGDIRSYLSDHNPASSLDVLGWRGAVMSPFYTEGDLERTPVLFSPSVRKMCCSQVGRAVLRQETAVRRYASRGIRTTCAQKALQFPGIARDVRAPLQLLGWMAVT
jgi:hypothetical protein